MREDIPNFKQINTVDFNSSSGKRKMNKMEKIILEYLFTFFVSEF